LYGTFDKKCYVFCSALLFSREIKRGIMFLIVRLFA
jgi:hypothetical protein